MIAILGNHDDEREMPAALAAKGFTVLKDARTRLTIRGEVMDFAGHPLLDLQGRRHRARHAGRRPARDPAGAHAEAAAARRSSSRCRPSSAGTPTAGQIVLPGIGAVAAREFPVIAGVEQRQGTTIFVSRGVGTVYVPVRINCPPEVAVLTLESVTRTVRRCAN